MVVKSFTLLNNSINRKQKARDRKENLTAAPPQSCFVTVSVFVGISVHVLVEGFRSGSECVQSPWSPRLIEDLQ